MREVMKIVVPTDFSEYSLRAVDEGVDLAIHYQAKLMLVHIVTELTGRALSIEVGMAREVLRQTLFNDANASFASLAPRLRNVEYETAIRTGRASSAIVEYADEVGADMIVIATHGRRGMARLFIGSTTEEVVRKAHCPVLTVRPVRGHEADPLTLEHAHHENCDCRREVISYKSLLSTRGAPIRVRDAMRRDVVKVSPSTRVREVIDLMIHYDISVVPVVDEDDSLLGCIPESHLLVRSLAELADNHEAGGATVHEFIEHQRHIYGKTAREVMVPVVDVIAVSDTAPLVDAVRLMLNHRVSRLPVLRASHVVGYLTRADILRVVRSLEEYQDVDIGDAEVAVMVAGALDRSPDLAITDTRVTAEKGVVTIHGAVSTAEEIHVATAIASRMPGVKAVSNCLLVEHLLH